MSFALYQKNFDLIIYRYNEKLNENLKFKLTYEWIFAVIATSCKIFFVLNHLYTIKERM